MFRVLMTVIFLLATTGGWSIQSGGIVFAVECVGLFGVGVAVIRAIRLPK